MSRSNQAFLTWSLRAAPWGSKIAAILAASITAVDPSRAVERNLQREGEILAVAGQQVDLTRYSAIYLLAIGKGAIPMASAVAEIIPDKPSTTLILTKNTSPAVPPQINGCLVFQGGHPIPDQTGLQASQEIISRLANLSAADLVIVLISGGGSALFTAPCPGISLGDLQKTNQVFLDHGLDIKEINTIRKHLSLVKGGRLAGLLFPAKTITLILSDVVGDPVDLIASGPTVPDPSTFQDALELIGKYQIKEILPLSVIAHLKAGQEGKFPETPKPDDPIFKGQIVQVIASNKDAVKGGLQEAVKAGFSAQQLPIPIEGEARLVGEKLASHLRGTTKPNHSPPICLITGGESIVTLTDSNYPGKGGRNLETALSTVRLLAGRNNIALITLATDGEDGLTDAAGAVVTGETLSRAAQVGLDPDKYLRNHDSYTFFKALDDLLLPGVTGTNTNDLCFLFIT